MHGGVWHLRGFLSITVATPGSPMFNSSRPWFNYYPRYTSLSIVTHAHTVTTYTNIPRKCHRNSKCGERKKIRLGFLGVEEDWGLKNVANAIYFVFIIITEYRNRQAHCFHFYGRADDTMIILSITKDRQKTSSSNSIMRTEFWRILHK